MIDHGITFDTILTNGSRLGDVYEHLRRELHDARTAARFKGPGKVKREQHLNQCVGRVQGYTNLLTLLGLDPHAEERP